VQVALDHKHLAKTKTFRWALAGPIVIGLVLAVLIGCNTELGGMCFSSSCVQGFFDVFKFPVAIMGLSLPLVAMAAAIHRSIEAAAQIEVASRQYGEAIVNNRFGNYLKHREGFEKLIDGYCSRRHFESGCKVYVLTASVYARIFPDASLVNVDWSGQFDKKRFDDIERWAKALMGEINKPKEDFDCVEFFDLIFRLTRAFALNYTTVMAAVIEVEGEPAKKVLLPKMDVAAKGVFNTVRDIFGILVLIRGYVGVNKVGDFPISRKYTHLAASLEYSSSEFRVVGLE